MESLGIDFKQGRHPNNGRSNKGATLLVVMALVTMAMIGTSSTTQSEVPMALTLAGPEYADMDSEYTFQGNLTLLDDGVPLQIVEVYTDDELVATTTTDLDGGYAVSFTFPQEGFVEVVAVALGGTVESAPVWVIVGGPQLSLEGPAVTGVIDPTDFSGAFTVGGMPLVGHTVDLYVDDQLVGNTKTDSDGDYLVPHKFTSIEEVVVQAIASAGTPAESISDPLNVRVDHVQSVAGGSYFTCAVIFDGSVYCWGENRWGQLGDGTTTDRWNPVKVQGITDAVAVTAGNRHSCALMDDGGVQCWGRNTHGQLGDGTGTDRLTPVDVLDLTDVMSVTTGDSHNCALLDDGTVRCWGGNTFGSLGDGTKWSRSRPVQAQGITDAVEVSVAGFHSCALIDDGTVRCWGFNKYGQLGDGTTSDRLTSVEVSGLTDPVAVTAGYYHTCALKDDGTSWCWGYNYHGQLGDNTTTDRSTPVQVSDLQDVAQITPIRLHTCAVLENGTAKCWGYNDRGQIGDGTMQTQRLTPVEVSDLTDPFSVDGGWSHTCAVEDSQAYCWGENLRGQLGGCASWVCLTPAKVIF